MLIVESQNLDVYHNLALEEYLMEQVVDRGPVLFLWRSGCAVVMGKNQNPWRECRLERMRAEQVPLARRISGGGTVYHDAGNLNYCVITDRTAYREDQAYEMVFEALASFDIRAARGGKSNLCVDGLKFSGNAFCFRKGRALHHGTLLLSTDLERLNRYLGSMIDGIETHAVASVPADVTNLGLDRNALCEALSQSFELSYGGGAPALRMDAMALKPEMEPLLERQRSGAWLYGHTPRFTVRRAETVFEVVKGEVVQTDGPDGSKCLHASFSDIAFSLFC